MPSVSELYRTLPEMPETLAIQQRWEELRAESITTYSGPYTLGSLYKIVTGETLELAVDTLQQQPRTMVIMEAADVNAAAHKIPLQLARLEGALPQFEEHRENLEQLYIQATLGQRVSAKAELDATTRSELIVSLRDFMQQLIITTGVLGIPNITRQRVRTLREDAEESVKQVMRLLQDRESYNYSRYGEPELDSTIENGICALLRLPINSVVMDSTQPTCNVTALEDMFGLLARMGEHFSDVDLAAIGRSYYAEGTLVFEDENGNTRAIESKGKNARNWPAGPDIDLKQVRRERSSHPLRMFENWNHPQVAAEQFRSMGSCIPGEDNRAHLAAIAGQELFVRNAAISVPSERIAVELR